MSGGVRLPPGFKLVEDPTAGVKVPSGFKLVEDTPPPGEDYLRSMRAGGLRGVVSLGGTPADIGGLIQTGVDWAARKVSGKSQEELEASRPMAIPRETMQKYGSGGLIDAVAKKSPGSDITYEGKSPGSRYAGKIAEFAPNMLGGVGGLGRRFVTQTLAPAIGNEALGSQFKGTKLEGPARFVGTVLGGAAPAAGARMATPFPASAERVRLADILEREGVTALTAGQRTGSKALRYTEEELGGNTVRDMHRRQGEQFTEAALRRTGTPGNRATPPVINDAFDRLGRQFNDLQSRAHTPLDQRLQTDLLDTVTRYQGLTTQAAPMIENTMNRLAAIASQNGGVIPGPAYQSIRSEIAEAARNSSHNETRHALEQIREHLDDAVERGGGLSRDDIKAYRETRRQYRNLMVVEKAIKGAGEATAEGMITPGKLRGAVENQNSRDYARGRGDFADLARAGEDLIKPMNDSGTAGRLRASVNTVGGITGALAGMHNGGDLTTGLMAGLAGAAAPKAAGWALTTTPVQRLLANQVFAGAGLNEDTRRAMLAAALLQAEPRDSDSENFIRVSPHK